MERILFPKVFKAGLVPVSPEIKYGSKVMHLEVQNESGEIKSKAPQTLKN